MAMVMDQQHAEHQLQQQPQQPQQTFKHHCRICKKGFSCGRALGGHMRAHGIVEDSAAETDDDISGCGGASEWDDKHNAHAGTKRMYALRTNPNRLKSCRVCENCGKEFVSWKSFLEHGKCISDNEEEVMGEGYGLGYDDDGSLPSSPRSGEDVVGCLGWSKGKRSRRTKVVLSEEENLANCLVLLSSARVDPAYLVETTEESCASASRDDDRRQQTAAFPAHAMEVATKATPVFAASPPAPNVPRGMFECKACKKVFSSHQALGGHRASHKKVKGCFAAKLDETAPEEVASVAHDHNFASASVSVAMVPFENKASAATGPAAPPLRKKAKVHECSICHRVFASGQALGGHKRCHWITSNAADPNLKLQPLPLPDHATLPPHLTLRSMFDAANSEQLDLNMPAPVDDSTRREIGSSLRLEMPAAIFLRSLIGTGNVSKKRANMSGDRQHNKIIIHSKDNHTSLPSFNVEEEVDSKLKLAKLSDLKDMNMGGESSPWLQVGIGSSPANDGSEA